MAVSPEPITADSPDLDSAEARMRRALNLQGSRARSDARPNDRRDGERTRQRFVQDGDVPVTIIHRPRPTGADALAVPASGRVGVAEAALATERTLRSRAERSLQEAQAMLRDLQTKQGHADLALHEARHLLRTEFQEREAQLQQELATERCARGAAEAALQDALAAAAILPAQPEPEPPAAPVPKPRKAASPRVPKVARVREPQPVKWWIKPTAKG